MDARVGAQRNVRVRAAPAAIGEHLVRHLPAVAVHRGLVARAVGDQVSRIRQRQWERRKTAAAAAIRHAATNRVITPRYNGYYVGVVEQIGRVKLTNPDKVLYPATGTTKAEVFDYYIDIAEAMLPHTAGRPATRKRWPNGVDEPSFFEKQLASSAPDWLDRAGRSPINRGRRRIRSSTASKVIGVDCAAGRTRGARAAVASWARAGHGGGGRNRARSCYPDRLRPRSRRRRQDEAALPGTPMRCAT